MGKNAPRDVLASRYASDEMVAIWGTETKIIMERKLWVAAMKGQKKAADVIHAYGHVIEKVNLESIAEREKKLRHDVKARIEEFNALASAMLGCEVQEIHEGFTSRDLTDNVEQTQILQALKLVRERSVAVLSLFGVAARTVDALEMCARTHNVPAQMTTLGKRFGGFAEEMHIAFKNLEHLIKNYPIRGIKGPVGTQQDMIDLLGSEDAAFEFEQDLQIAMEWPGMLECVGQVYPRSLDFQVVSVLVQLAAAPSNFALMVRLMAGHELMHEGFGKDQTGSSAMPHKMNSRTCERIMGLTKVLRGYLTMVSELAGDQWFEGDVSCSVVRRVAIQGAFMALDGLFESLLTVLDEMQVYHVMLEKELKTFLPFLNTTAILTDAVKRGVGREDAHKSIKRAALYAIAKKREGGAGDGIGTFTMELMTDPVLGFDNNLARVEELLGKRETGRAVAQARLVDRRMQYIFNKYPEAIGYKPAKIL